MLVLAEVLLVEEFGCCGMPITFPVVVNVVVNVESGGLVKGIDNGITSWLMTFPETNKTRKKRMGRCMMKAFEKVSVRQGKLNVISKQVKKIQRVGKLIRKAELRSQRRPMMLRL